MSVDAVTADWLKGDASYVEAVDAPVLAAWGSAAAAGEVVSALANAPDAQAEAARRVEFLGQAIGVERVRVAGLRADLLGGLVDVTTHFGEVAAARCFVIGVEEQDDVEATVLTILRRLG